MENLLKNQKSIMISSLNKNNEPAISYAPFVIDNNEIYIYISKAADHYYNLLENKKCAVMAIEDEKECKTIFARERVSFNCEAEKINDNLEKVFKLFDEVHGSQMMMVLRTMDFDLFKLTIKDGRLVKGFGKAYDIEIENNEFKLNQVQGTGHSNK